MVKIFIDEGTGHRSPIPEGIMGVITRFLKHAQCEGKFTLQVGPSVRGNDTTFGVSVVRGDRRWVVVKIQPGDESTRRLCWLIPHATTAGALFTHLQGIAAKPTTPQKAVISPRGFADDPQKVEAALRVLAAKMSNGYMAAHEARRVLNEDVGLDAPPLTLGFVLWCMVEKGYLSALWGGLGGVQGPFMKTVGYQLGPRGKALLDEKDAAALSNASDR